MSKKSEFLSCDCCDLTCPAPVAVFEYVNESMRFVGSQHPADGKLYNKFEINISDTQTRNITNGDNYSITSGLNINGESTNTPHSVDLTIEAVLNCTMDQVLRTYDGVFGSPVLNTITLTSTNQSSTTPSPSPIVVDYDYADPADPFGDQYSDSFNVALSVTDDGITNGIIPRTDILGYTDGDISGDFTVVASGSDTTPYGETITLTTTTPGITIDENHVTTRDNTPTEEIDVDYVCANLPSAGTPTDEDYTESVGGVDSNVVVNTGITYKVQAGAINYYYRGVVRKIVRVKLEAPVDAFSDYYEVSYIIKDEAGAVVTADKIEFSEVGVDFFSDYIDLPVPADCTEEFSFELVKYRCYHGGKWQSFA